MAKHYYERILKLDEKNTEALYGVGKIKFYENNYDECLTHLRNIESVD